MREGGPVGVTVQGDTVHCAEEGMIATVEAAAHPAPAGRKQKGLRERDQAVKSPGPPPVTPFLP